MRGKGLVLKVLSYLGFLTSAVFTYKLNADLAEGLTEQLIAGAVTLVMQFSSFFFFHKTVYDKGGKRAFYGSLSVLLFLLSIVATISFQVARENRITNDMVGDSVEFKRAEEDREIFKRNRNLLNKSIERAELDLKETKDFYKGELRKIEKEKEVLFATKKANKVPWRDEQVEKLIDKVAIRQQALVKEMGAKVSEKDAKLSMLISQSQDISSLSTPPITFQTLDEKGNLGLAGRISALSGWKKNNIALTIQIILAIVFELTAVALHLASMEGAYVGEIKARKPTHAKVVVDRDDVGEVDKKRYMNAVLKLSKGDVSVGYKKIANSLSWTDAKGKRVHKALEKDGKLKIEGGTTYIIERRKGA